MEVLSSSGPPNQAVLESQRKLRQNEVAAQAVFRRLAVYALFVFVVFSIGYINRDARSYNIRRNLDNAIYFTTKQTFGFESVRSTNYLYLKHKEFRNVSLQCHVKLSNMYNMAEILPIRRETLSNQSIKHVYVLNLILSHWTIIVLNSVYSNIYDRDV